MTQRKKQLSAVCKNINWIPGWRVLLVRYRGDVPASTSALTDEFIEVQTLEVVWLWVWLISLDEKGREEKKKSWRKLSKAVRF